ncbi:DUF1269 domain-containing protein [Cellulomonas fimi]|uniref:Membrane protein of uknown function UCP014873 n=1 Tax=Cellulomonas fimi (strain ATCC 484 / DSM 20113 / JCM 1341 / CCUG 24087 / LMG 16345 / NBRC 15513 / NCIMB 8980 / NCTC 7547 / NRS-133) TaxID=590998 RepID=F4GY60_CELFA|nr:DUF1269 domain-containing protein [Cellulomonas fimi]AEE44728.1 membrane protein of uknown function UCP014873 [Cellulomonas fimi ATCC 484]NNH06129.1 DUF1269 domain-containing protein [Cellulomonas fimi]VEH27128.1 Predicted membrane protein [Cellulomonas fimi]
MTTFTAWKFDTPDGARAAETALKAASSDGLVTILDHAVVEWRDGEPKPDLHHGHEDKWRGTGWGAFWGLLFGGLFFVPLLGAAAGAAVGAISKAVAAVGIDEAQLQTIREQVTPGTSLLCAVTTDGDLDRLGERFHGLHSTLVATNLTDAERSTLMETFG